MKRKVTFAKAVDKPRLVKLQDSRFMNTRTIMVNPERQRIGTYMSPGKGPNGEHQN
jgi:hypothetical protein